MTTSYSTCPKCTENVPSFYPSEDDKTKIEIACECGYDETMTYAEYVSLYEKTPKRPTPETLFKCQKHNLVYTHYCDMCDIHLCDTCTAEHEAQEDFESVFQLRPKTSIEILRKQLKEAYDYLNSYFPSLKDKAISRSNDLKEQIENAYNKFYTKNKQILDFYKIIFDNFIEHNYPFQHIIDDLTFFDTNPKNFIAFNIYPCIEDKNDKSVIDFFNSYNFIRSEESRTILNIDNIPQDILFLKDNRLALCLNRNPAILILDPSNDYHIDLKIPGTDDYTTNSICEMETGDIVAGFYEHSIHVYSITKNSYKEEMTIENAHQRKVEKVVTLSNNFVASCGSDDIKIWDMSTYAKKEPVKILKGHENGVYSLLYVKEKNFLISVGCYESDLRVWNLDTYQCVNVFAGVEGSTTNCLYKLDEERVVAGGTDMFHIINISTLKIEEKVDLEEYDVYYLSVFMKLRDGSLLCGTQVGHFIVYNFTTKKVEVIKTTHLNQINDIKRIDDNSFYTTSCDLKLRLWKY